MRLGYELLQSVLLRQFQTFFLTWGLTDISVEKRVGQRQDEKWDMTIWRIKYDTWRHPSTYQNIQIRPAVNSSTKIFMHLTDAELTSCLCSDFATSKRLFEIFEIPRSLLNNNKTIWGTSYAVIVKIVQLQRHAVYKYFHYWFSYLKNWRLK